MSLWRLRWFGYAVAGALAMLLAAGCGGSGHTTATHTTATRTVTRASSTALISRGDGGVPPLINRADVYAADRPGHLTGAARLARSLIYVPNSGSASVDEIDPQTYKIVRHFSVGALPQHVVPAYDLTRLWVTNDNGKSLTPIDPRTGTPRQADPR